MIHTPHRLTRDHGLPTLGDFGRFYLAKWRGDRALRNGRPSRCPKASAQTTAATSAASAGPKHRHHA